MWPRTRAQRSAVPFPVISEKLTLESRDVDADGTLGFAGAALEAQRHDLFHALVAETCFVQPPSHREPQHVRASPRRMRLFFGRHIRRAHRAVERLATGAQAAAHLDGAAHAAVL